MPNDEDAKEVPPPAPKRGDIICYLVTPQSEWSSRLVAAGEIMFRAGQGLQCYSHVAIYDEDGYQYESKVPWSCRSKIELHRCFEVRRITHKELTEMERGMIIGACRARLYELYDIVSLLTFGHFGLPHSNVCSEFVNKVYMDAGIDMDEQGKPILTPNAIADATKLVYRWLPK